MNQAIGVVLSFLTLSIAVTTATAAEKYKREEMVIIETPVASNPFEKMDAFSSKVNTDPISGEESYDLDIPNSTASASTRTSSFSDQLGNPMSETKETPLRSIGKKKSKSQKITAKKAKKNKLSARHHKKKKGGSAQRRARSHRYSSL